MQILPFEYRTKVRNAVQDWHAISGDDTTVFTCNLNTGTDTITVTFQLSRETTKTGYTITTEVTVTTTPETWENICAGEKHQLEKEFTQILNAHLLQKTTVSLDEVDDTDEVCLTWEETFDHEIPSPARPNSDELK